MRVHDTFAASHLDSTFIDRFNALRQTRNQIVHSVDKNLVVHIKDVLDSLLFMHKALFPDEIWAPVRRFFLETTPNSELGAKEYVVNVIACELELVLELLAPAQSPAYFGVDKKPRRYICPECYSHASTDSAFEHKLAVLRPKGLDSATLYCIVSSATRRTQSSVKPANLTTVKVMSLVRGCA